MKIMLLDKTEKVIKEVDRDESYELFDLVEYKDRFGHHGYFILYTSNDEIQTAIYKEVCWSASPLRIARIKEVPLSSTNSDTKTMTDCHTSV